MTPYIQNGRCSKTKVPHYKLGPLHELISQCHVVCKTVQHTLQHSGDGLNSVLRFAPAVLSTEFYLFMDVSLILYFVLLLW